jgi:predicted dehydrogenase
MNESLFVRKAGMIVNINENSFKDFKVAFIGAGYMATEHAKAFGDIAEVQLSGIYSRTRSRAEEIASKYLFGAVFSSIGEMYQKTKADLVVIAVPELSVMEVSLEAFEYPWVCLIEKPAGYDIEEAKEILDAARRKKRKVFLSLNRRQYSSTCEVLNDIENHNGQRLVHVFDQENPRISLESGTPQKVTDNWMFANSIHVIDYFRLFCRGNLMSVDNLSPWRPNEPCFVLAKLTYSSGDIGMYEAIWEGPGPWAVIVTTNSRRWELRPLEQASYQDYKSRKLESISVHSWDLKFKPGLRRQAAEAIRALEGVHHQLSTLEDGLQTMKIAAKIYGK